MQARASPRLASGEYNELRRARWALSLIFLDLVRIIKIRRHLVVNTRPILRILAIVLAFMVVLASGLDAKDVQVRGYTRKDGTYVRPHVRTSPNKTRNDNYSTRGNVNPYTGKAGTKPRDNESIAYDPAKKLAYESTTVPAVKEAPKARGWGGMKSGLHEGELKEQLGSPLEVEKQGSHEIWTYQSGIVFVKEGKVVAWKESKGK